MSKRRLSERGLSFNRFRRQVLAGVFRLLYRFGGRIYDALVATLFGSAWDEWRAAACDRLGGEPVIDLGCGTGAALAELARRRIQTVGIERSRSMLAAARRRAALPLIRADAHALPLPRASVGACLATFPAPFILDRTVLDEVARVLRPGGRFVVLLGGVPTQVPFPPARLLLRLTYGERDDVPLPDGDLLNHELLPGTWHRQTTASGHALLWIAERRSCS